MNDPLTVEEAAAALAKQLNESAERRAEAERKAKHWWTRLRRAIRRMNPKIKAAAINLLCYLAGYAIGFGFVMWWFRR